MKKNILYSFILGILVLGVVVYQQNKSITNEIAMEEPGLHPNEWFIKQRYILIVRMIYR